MPSDEWDAKARELARGLLLNTQAIQVEGTSDNASGYGPPYKAPWHIVDTSKADPEVNWPGELIEVVTDPGMIPKRLMAAREKIALAVIREAYQRGRNEADTAAERRGIERAAKWHDANAAACTKLVDEGIEVEANEDAYWFHKNAADHLRALAPPMADAGPTEPAGAKGDNDV